VEVAGIEPASGEGKSKVPTIIFSFKIPRKIKTKRKLFRGFFSLFSLLKRKKRKSFSKAISDFLTPIFFPPNRKKGDGTATMGGHGSTQITQKRDRRKKPELSLFLQIEEQIVLLHL